MFEKILNKVGLIKASQLQKLIDGPIEQMLNRIQSLSGRNIYPDGKVFKTAEKYTTSDDIYSIIRLLSTTTALIPFQTYKFVNDTYRKKLRQHIKEPLLKKAYQVKALKELDEGDPLNILLERPNQNMGKFEFYEALYSFLYLHGECIMLKQRVDLGPNKGKTRQLHLLFPQHVVIKVTNSYPHQIISYNYIVNGMPVAVNIPPEDIIHIRYFNPILNIDGTELRGLSPIKVLAKRIQRMDTNIDTSNKQLKNGGTPGVVYDKNSPADWKQAAEFTGKRKKNFYEYLQNLDNKGAPYFANGEMGYLPLGLSLVDLESIALEKVDFKKCCNAYGISDILFNNDDGSKYDNVQSHMKRLYTGAGLPTMYRVRDAFQLSLASEYKGENKFVDCDITEIPELQEDSQKTTTWLNTAWWLSGNEKREVQNYERDANPLMDEYLVPANLVPISELGIQDLQMTNDYNGTQQPDNSGSN